MKNFFWGLQAITENFLFFSKQLSQYQLFWGFAVGFFVATLFYGFLITDHPKQVPTVLFHDSSSSFQKIYQRKEGQAYSTSFYDFSKKANRLKTAFLLAGILAIVLTLISLLTVFYG
ncbi:TPA: hypothetical protein DEP34_00175 [Candidatus Uhrbacteria bacterium]|uniref:DUF3899 domain-containing protein n=2 Tax=Candidatus Uhriibacteriota TaxID=1752732 RepID=A0A0G1Q9T0_9BACT|nr:MAG: hypothetical protein UX45_C0002G0036 [Candidatus Uhrbacteria bacterium GW2011_GWF2_46_218]KKU41811.1 MAG: hypothetical protein UX57_C0001G0035 [Candidatus Uhrbacteria bacterium GW2011_GWE2_46_68]HBK34139.1 hypothetical protein [Candidatus Uhrbacteria bacterium]HCB18789.1 hypothetical protein [Candidatus Uhrbacteria bacterium]